MVLSEIEKSQRDTNADMGSEYLNNRFKELGVKEDTKVRLIPSISGDGSELGGERIFSHYHYLIKRIEFVEKKIRCSYTSDLDLKKGCCGLSDRQIKEKVKRRK